MRGARSIKIALLALSLLLGGCYDKVELNELAVVDLMAIDLAEDGRLKVSLQIIIPGELVNAGSSGGAGQNPAPYYVIEATGSTLPEAFDALQAKLSRRLFTSHIQAIIIGEELARSGIAPVFDSLTRIRELRVHMMVVATRGDAAELLKVSPRLSKLPSTAMTNLLNQDIVPLQTIREVSIALASVGQDPFLPVVGLGERVESQSGQDRNLQEFELTGIAIFQGDRLVGFGPLEPAKGLAWLLNKEIYGTITLDWPPDDRRSTSRVEPSPLAPYEIQLQNDAPPGDGAAGAGSDLAVTGKITPLVIRGKTNIHSEVKDGEISINVFISAVDDLVTDHSGLDLSDPSLIPDLEFAMEKAHERRLHEVLHLAQSVYQADIFGFGELIHRNHPKVWREVKQDWHTVFSSLRVNLSLDIDLRRVGLTNSPAVLRREQLRK